MDTEQLRAIVRELSRISPEDHPFISLYLDMQVDQHGLRPSLTYVKNALIRQARFYGSRGSDLESFEADAQKIEELLAGNFDPSDKGLAVFACTARGFFKAVPLHLVPESRLVVAQAPRVYQLARFLDDYETYCVAVVSRTSARIYTVVLGDIDEMKALTRSARHVSKTLAGGWSQGNYQRHVEQNIRRFAQETVEEIKKVCLEQHVSHLVLAGEVVVLADVERILPRELADNAIKVGRLDVRTPEHQILAEILPIVRAHERTEERGIVQELEETAASGDMAVLGIEPTLFAMEQGQVDQLVMSRDFAAVGWRCQACLSYGFGGQPDVCPYCGGDPIQVDLRESMVGAANRTDATIEFVKDAPNLDELGGVGAFLRYPLS